MLRSGFPSLCGFWSTAPRLCDSSCSLCVVYIIGGQNFLYQFGFFLECTLLYKPCGLHGQVAECFFFCCFFFIAFVVGTQGSLSRGLFFLLLRSVGYTDVVCSPLFFFLFGERALKITCRKCGLSFVFLHPFKAEDECD